MSNLDPARRQAEDAARRNQPAPIKPTTPPPVRDAILTAHKFQTQKQSGGGKP